MEFKASTKYLVDSSMLIILGFFVIIMPYLLRSKNGLDTLSAVVGIVVIGLGVYFYNRARRLRVIIKDDKIEYIGHVKSEDRTLLFRDIYLLETVNTGGISRTFIVDKYKDGARTVVRGTIPPSTEKELGRGKDIKLDFRKSVSIDSKRIGNYEKAVEEISKRLSRDRVGHETENMVKKLNGEKIENISGTLSDEDRKRIKKINLVYKTVMILNIFSLLIISMLLEGNSPIINNENIVVYLSFITIYIINIALNILFLVNNKKKRFANNKSITAISYTGIILSLGVIIPLLMRMFS